jgi:hypothetical protein
VLGDHDPPAIRTCRHELLSRFVRCGIRDGAWPSGLGPWLAQALPAVLAESGLPPGH